LISFADFDEIPTQLKKLRTVPSNIQFSIVNDILEQLEFRDADVHIKVADMISYETKRNETKVKIDKFHFKELVN